MASSSSSSREIEPDFHRPMPLTLPSPTCQTASSITISATQSDGQPQSSQSIDLALGDWTLKGDGVSDQISASMSDYAMLLSLSSTKPPALHNGDGYFEWAPATGSVLLLAHRHDRRPGRLRLVDRPNPLPEPPGWTTSGATSSSSAVEVGIGIRFSSAITNRSCCGTVATVNNNVIFGSGTFVDADGKTEQLNLNDFEIKPTGTWKSPHSGATYPSGWTVTIQSKHLTLTLDPVLQDQELDTRSSTGVIYWEGDVSIKGNENGSVVDGQGYIELTGYATNLSSP